ncbi:MAG: PIN domain-containing protein [Trueperaceae bacterium]|nr:MAG: PIN domain-containing protein [Trueperaceae bacterium]
MTLCDVNIYLRAYRTDLPDHPFYYDWLNDLLHTPTTFAYSDIVLSAFVRIVTHARIFKTPTPLDEALAFTNVIRTHPAAIGLMPGAKHWNIFERLCKETRARGNTVPDAYLAALAIESGVTWVTADSGFRNYRGLNWTLLEP